MISYNAYKLLHLTGIFVVLLTLGTLLAQAPDAAWRKRLSMLNGIGLVIAFVAGFGLLARLGISWPWQGWVFVKMLIWLLFGLSVTMVKRHPDKTQFFWWVILSLSIFAAYLANFKPF